MVPFSGFPRLHGHRLECGDPAHLFPQPHSLLSLGFSSSNNLPMSDSDSDLPDLVDLPIDPPSPSTLNPDPVPLGQQPYDFENEPVEVWDTFSVRPTPRSQPPSPVKFVFSRHWLSREERGLGYPPRSIGMKVQMGTVHLEVSPIPCSVWILLRAIWTTRSSSRRCSNTRVPLTPQPTVTSGVHSVPAPRSSGSPPS